MGLIARILIATGMIILLICWILEVAYACGSTLFLKDRPHTWAVSAERRRHDEFAFQVSWITDELAKGRLSSGEAERLMEAARARLGAD